MYIAWSFRTNANEIANGLGIRCSTPELLGVRSWMRKTEPCAYGIDEHQIGEAITAASHVSTLSTIRGGGAGVLPSSRSTAFRGPMVNIWR